MLRIFFFLLLILLLGFGFAWFADRPGEVVLEWQGTEYQTSLMVVLIGLVALIATIMVLWWLARSILDSPALMQRFWSTRKKDRGYKALSQGLIAANSGDAAGARRFSKDSMKLLGDQPLVNLLDAQTALLEGKRDLARQKFETMLGDDETKLVALRGLYLEAERQGAKEAARHYAEEAYTASAALPWAGNAMLRFHSMEGDWQSSLDALEANRSTGLVTKVEARRQRAVLLTAQAMVEEPADPDKAAKLAREAHKLAPELVAAAIIGAKALTRNNDLGRAAGMIETVWKKEPHPELAAAYVHLRIGDSASDRLKRANKLAGMKANHIEGNIAIAEAAIEAQDWKLARETMKPVLTTNLTERACLIMADIEEGEYGDKGRMRDWLSRAVRSPRDAAWTADGYVSNKWLPVSPITGKIDSFEWKVPVEQLGAPIDASIDTQALDDLIREPQEPAAEAAPSEEEAKTEIDSSGTSHSAEVVETESLSELAEDAEIVEIKQEETASSDDFEEIEITEDTKPEVIEAEVVEAEVVKPEPDQKEAKSVAKNSTTQQSSKKRVAESEEPEEVEFPLKQRPDDPGVREEEGNSKDEDKKLFGIF